MLDGPSLRINGSHFTYGCPPLSAAYVCYLYLQNHLVTIQLLVRHVTWRLCWLPLARESLCYNTIMGAPPQV